MRTLRARAILLERGWLEAPAEKLQKGEYLPLYCVDLCRLILTRHVRRPAFTCVAAWRTDTGATPVARARAEHHQQRR